MFKKAISLILSISLVLTQPVFAQGVAELNIGKYLNQMPAVKTDSFRPAHLRYVSYDIASNDFKLLLDQGDAKLSNSLNSSTPKLQESTQELFNYFLIGLSLPNDKFWVNLRPDAPEQIIDPLLEKTDMGKIMLEADLQLKKDTSSLTSPQTPEGKEYWDKLYKKAGELFPAQNITIPTITRPWIVPGEVIIRESEDSVYIYKANLKVMLEEDYISSQPSAVSFQQYTFNDPRLKELNKYSTELIKELILPRLTQEVNTSKKYAQLRQVFFSLILSRWFKDKYGPQSSVSGLQSRVSGFQSSGQNSDYIKLIDSGNLDNLASQVPWSKDYYFSEYKKSFQQGEYNLKEQVSAPIGQVIRSYVSGGANLTGSPKPLIDGSFVGSPILTKMQKYAIASGLLVLSFFGSSVSHHLSDPTRLISEPRRSIETQRNLDNAIKSNKNILKGSIERIKDDPDGDIGGDIVAFESILEYTLTILNTLNDGKQKQEEVIKALEIEIGLWRSEYSSNRDIGRFLDKAQELLNMEKDKKKIGSSPLAPQEAEARFNRIISDYKASIEVFIKEVNEKAASWSAKKLLVLELESFVKLAVDGQLRYQNSDEKTPPMMGRIVIDLIMAADGYIERIGKDIDYAYDSGRVKAAGVLNGCRKTMKKLIEDLEDLLGDMISDIFSGSSPLAPQTIQAQDAKLETGGIDFTRINYLTQPMGSFRGLDLRLPRLSKAELEGIDINRELAAIEQMINARIEVSTDRLKRLLAAMSQEDAFTAQRETQLLPLLLRLCWLKEEKGTETTPDFRAILLIADTGLFVE